MGRGIRGRIVDVDFKKILLAVSTKTGLGENTQPSCGYWNYSSI